ncbi:hypothetical protein Tco_0217256 [Tanacetum coccineum]
MARLWDFENLEEEDFPFPILLMATGRVLIDHDSPPKGYTNFVRTAVTGAWTAGVWFLSVENYCTETMSLEFLATSRMRLWRWKSLYSILATTAYVLD